MQLTERPKTLTHRPIASQQSAVSPKKLMATWVKTNSGLECLWIVTE